jgi:tRNA (guanine26-N2/guanine27-N2)-dimethyltransferase
MENFSVIKSNEYIGSEKTDKDIGPIWMGKLGDLRLIKELRTNLFEKKLKTKNELWKLLDLLEEEADASAFFYSTDGLASELKKSPHKMEDIFVKLKKEGFEATKTHFSKTGFKTNAPLDKIKKVI